MGDFNLYLLKRDEHAPTMEYFNIWYNKPYLLVPSENFDR